MLVGTRRWALDGGNGNKCFSQAHFIVPHASIMNSRKRKLPDEFNMGSFSLATCPRYLVMFIFCSIPELG